MTGPNLSPRLQVAIDPESDSFAPVFDMYLDLLTDKDTSLAFKVIHSSRNNPKYVIYFQRIGYSTRCMNCWYYVSD